MRVFAEGAEAPASIRNKFCIFVLLQIWTLIAAIGLAIIILCNGSLIYSLDDPYITLALSENIAHGHYGINAAEASSPSSSILYPFILTIFAWARWHDWVPALVNAIAAVGTGALVATEFCRIGIITRPDRLLRGALLTATLCVAFNVIGLVFTGLEHSLHLLMSLVVLIFLTRVIEGGLRHGYPLQSRRYHF